MTRSPDMAELLDIFGDSLLARIHTALPGKIDSYDPETQTCSVQPMLKDVDVADDETEIADTIPIIQEVPVVFPRGGGFFITWPLEQGDFCQLLVNERSIDIYAEGDGASPVDPKFLHRFDLTDVVCIPGFYPKQKAVTDIDDARMSLGKDESGMQLHIAQDHVEVTFDGGVTIKLEAKDGDAKLTLGDGAVAAAIADHLKTYINSLVDEISQMHDNHTHPLADFIAPLIPLSTAPTIPGTTPAPPSMKPTIPASLTGYDDAITSSKLKFPDG